MWRRGVGAFGSPILSHVSAPHWDGPSGTASEQESVALNSSVKATPSNEPVGSKTQLSLARDAVL